MAGGPPNGGPPVGRIHVYASNQVGLRYRLEGVFMRTLVTLACTECKRRNYTTKKNKQNNPDRIELKKYCKWCNAHTVHKETR